MSWLITGGNTYIPMDSSAASYITAVETADGQVLEPAVRCAIDQFVLGCKADGIWTAIKASCILAGARTLTGALVPLVGTAPTNNGPFVSGDYNRKTGLVGDGSTKYLNSNRNNNADLQNSKHLAVYASTAHQSTSGVYIGAGVSSTGDSCIGVNIVNTQAFIRVHNSTVDFVSDVHAAVGFIGASRSAGNNYTARFNASNNLITRGSQTPSSSVVLIFARGSVTDYTNARLAFYSIGESLNLALLDARVTTLVNAFAAAIP
jgi:hypothetical protein